MTYNMTRPATYKFNGIGCNTCIVNECTHPAVASFDANGEILMPSGGVAPGMGKYFANQAKPIHARPIPCAFDVLIAGCANHHINGSWCQNCGSINNIYYTRPYTINGGIQTRFYGGAREPWRINTGSLLPDAYKIADIPLCDKQNSISACGIGNLCIYLMVGPEEGLPENRGTLELINPTYFPSGTMSYIYKYHDPNQVPYIPPRHLYAIANLEYTPQAGGGIEQCCGENNGFWFKTDLGEWKGDYGGTTITGIPYIQDQDSTMSYYNDCLDKYYHGDFDGRSLSFTIYGSDIVEGGNSYNTSLSRTARLCDFDSMIIDVSPAESTYPENITYNSNAPYHSITYASGETQWQEYNCGRIEFDGFGFVDDIRTPYGKSYGAEWTSTTSGFDYISLLGYGLMPQVITCEITGVTTTNPIDPTSEDMTIHTCNNCENINGTHILEHDSQIWSVGYGVEVGQVDGWSKNLNPINTNNDNPNVDRTLCCNCPDDLCINKIEVGIEQDSSGTFIFAKILGGSSSVALVEFRHHFNNGTTKLHEDAFNGSFVLFFYDATLEFWNTCNIDYMDITVNFNKNSNPEFNCADPIYTCTYCKDTRPDNIGITIGDFTVNDGIPSWDFDCDTGPLGGSYITDLYCDTLSSITQGKKFGCVWRYSDTTSCIPYCACDSINTPECGDQYACFIAEMCAQGIYIIEVSIFPNFGQADSINLGVGNITIPDSCTNAMCVHVAATLYPNRSGCDNINFKFCGNGIIHFITGFPLMNWGTQIRCLEGEWSDDNCYNLQEFNTEHIMGGVYIDCNILNGLSIPYVGTTVIDSVHCNYAPKYTYNGADAVLSLS